MKVRSETLLDGLLFPESPRWHEGKLWFSDMYAHTVNTVDLNGRTETIVNVNGRPSGLGWLPDGRLLMVSMLDRRLLRLDAGSNAESLTTVADLSLLAPAECNDMVVDRQGRAFIGNFGFDLFCETPRVEPTVLVQVLPDGDIRVVAENLFFPNGSVITPDGRTLIVAESFAARLSAFTILEDGTLTDRYLWAYLEGTEPDGICLDEAGAVWVASPNTSEVLRVRKGGEILSRLSVKARPYACMLGGADRRTLFILIATSSNPEECERLKSGRIEMIQVDVPGCGLP